MAAFTRSRWSYRAAGAAVVASTMTFGFGRSAAAIGAVTISPDTNLPNTASVNVSGTGFTPNTLTEIFQCADLNSVPRCTDNSITPPFQTNSSGAFGPRTVNVTADFQSEGELVPCKTNCRIEVVQFSTGGFGQDGITFDKHTK